MNVRPTIADAEEAVRVHVVNDGAQATQQMVEERRARDQSGFVILIGLIGDAEIEWLVLLSNTGDEHVIGGIIFYISERGRKWFIRMASRCGLHLLYTRLLHCTQLDELNIRFVVPDDHAILN